MTFDELTANRLFTTRAYAAFPQPQGYNYPPRWVPLTFVTIYDEDNSPAVEVWQEVQPNEYARIKPEAQNA